MTWSSVVLLVLLFNIASSEEQIQEPPFSGSIFVDDECQDGQCALSALQRRAGALLNEAAAPAEGEPKDYVDSEFLLQDREGELTEEDEDPEDEEDDGDDDDDAQDSGEEEERDGDGDDDAQDGDVAEDAVGAALKAPVVRRRIRPKSQLIEHGNAGAVGEFDVFFDQQNGEVTSMLDIGTEAGSENAADSTGGRRRRTLPPTPAPPVIAHCVTRAAAYGAAVAADAVATPLNPNGTAALIANGSIDASGAVCPAHMKCVEKLGGGWSQCVDCRKHVFKGECQKLPDRMRFPAIQACQKTCLDTKCYNKNWCLPPYHCIKDPTDANAWGQCVRCNSKKTFKSTCHAWSAGLKKEAHRVCHKSCKWA